MPNAHDTAKRQLNLWITLELAHLLEQEAIKQGTTVATVVRKRLHSMFGKKCPYDERAFLNPGGRPFGSKNRNSK